MGVFCGRSDLSFQFGVIRWDTIRGRFISSYGGEHVLFVVYVLHKRGILLCTLLLFDLVDSSCFHVYMYFPDIRLSEVSWSLLRPRGRLNLHIIYIGCCRTFDFDSSR